MLKIEITDNREMLIEADGKMSDILTQCTIAVANILKMANEQFGDKLPGITDFIIKEAQEPVNFNYTRTRKRTQKGEKSNGRSDKK